MMLGAQPGEGRELPVGVTLQAQLAKKIIAVMQAITHIPKRGHNDFHNYSYATEADVADAVRSALIEHQLVLLPNVVEVREREITTRNQKAETVTTVTIEYTFIDAETGATRTFRMVGAGQDPGDKGIMKAVTAAGKYAALKAFCMATGDDPEADAGTDRTAAEREPGDDVVEIDMRGEYRQEEPPSDDDPAAPPKDDCISEGKVRFLYVAMQKVARATGQSLDVVKEQTLARVQKELHVKQLEWIPWRGQGYKKLVAWLEAQEKGGG
jgi:hypothetical protein